jgi:hypothetical protein
MSITIQTPIHSIGGSTPTRKGEVTVLGGGVNAAVDAAVDAASTGDPRTQILD